MTAKQITGTALLLALALVAQSIRLFVPLPPIVSVFLVGSIVSTTEVLAAWIYGWKAGLSIALITPLVALLQGFLPFPPLAFIVALASSAYVLMAYYWRSRSMWKLYIFTVACRLLTLFLGSFLAMWIFELPMEKGLPIFMTLGMPQVVTASLGLVLGHFLWRRLGIR